MSITRDEIKGQLLETLTSKYGAGSGLSIIGKDIRQTYRQEWLQVDEIGESHLDIDHLVADILGWISQSGGTISG